MSTSTAPRLLSFEEFIEFAPDDERIYELVGGRIVPMAEPSGRHESIRSDLAFFLEMEKRSSNLSLEIHPKILCKLAKRDGRRPDLIVMNRDRWAEATKKAAALFTPPELVVEIVSTNREEDYQKKALWYAAFGVLEYWIVDALELLDRYPNRKNPKIQVPTLSVGNLQEGVYKWQRFQGDEPVQSEVFSNLTLTVAQILA